MIRRYFTTLRRSLILWLTVPLAVFSSSPALADIMLYPTRVVVERGARSAQVEIINRGEEAATYRIRVVNRRMSEIGEIVPVDTALPGEKFVDKMMRYTPRQITLQPGASQTVRISIRKPADLAPGEYRSHLQFDRIADAVGLADLEAGAGEQPNEVSIKLQTLIGASIPVIVRHGETSASVTLDALQFDPGPGGAAPELGFTFRRAGNRSVYGDIVATYTAPGAAPIRIGSATGIAVYVPNAERKARLPLQVPEGVVLRGGEIGLQYNERADTGGALIAQATVSVP